MNKTKIIGLFVASSFIFSCNPQKKIAGNYEHKTECLGVEGDGSQTVKAWGMGKNRADAIEQARKNAVKDVLFKGVSYGKPCCEVKPLVLEVNAQQKYEDYFNVFFQDSGMYRNFVTNKDESFWSKEKLGAGTEVSMGVIMRVLRVDLKKKLLQDNILKP